MNSFARLVHDMVANDASGYPSSAASLDEAERAAAMELESALLRAKVGPAHAAIGRAEDWLASPPASREGEIMSAAAEDWLASPPIVDPA